MIQCAYLFWPSNDEPYRLLAGLSVLTRQILLLQDLGITEIFLLDTPSNFFLEEDSRIHVSVQTTLPTPLKAGLLLRADLVWHPVLGKQILQNIPNPEELIMLSQENLGLYLAGKEILARLIVAGANRLHEEALSIENTSINQIEKAHFIVLGSSSTALPLLLSSLSKPLDGVIARSINRKISLRITGWLLSNHIQVTPNQMTLFAASFGFFAICSAYTGAFLLAAFFLQLQSILDGCDGELARLTYLRSRFGEWLDNVCDDLIDTFFLLAVGVSLAAQGQVWTRYLAFISLCSLIFYHGTQYYTLWTKAAGSGNPFLFRWWFQQKASGPYLREGQNTVGRFFQKISNLLQAASRRDFYLFFYLLAAFFNCVIVAFFWHVICALVAGITTLLQWILAGPPQADPPQGLS